MTLGPLMMDIAGTTPSAEDLSLLEHPFVGGLILSTRNFESPAQLEALTAGIHALRTPPLLVAVDQEGGRVQRFREPFTGLPPAHRIGRRYDIDPEQGRVLAEHCGWLMAAELRAVGVDLSFAPVLDLDWGLSDVIGDRALHRDPEVVAELAGAYVAGMHAAGMAATGKHFPGHGGVVADSHSALPVDRRPYADIMDDLIPFERLIAAGLPGVMVAHVVYWQVDPSPASFSSRWLGEELRSRLDFRGPIFSDDLDMGAAAAAGDMVTRATAALDAGCDMILACNNRPGVVEIVDALGARSEPASQIRLVRMHGKPMPGRDELTASRRWREAVEILRDYLDKPELHLDA